MNGAQLHLLINHVPVLIPFIGAIMIAIGLAMKSPGLRETGVWLIVIAAVCAIPVYLTGEAAEQVLKNYPGTSRLLIEDHQGSAQISLILIEITGAAGLLFLYGSRFKRPFILWTWIWGLLLLLCSLSFVSMARTAHLGGLIHHEEIRGSDRF
jgi:uncharacterized membrane protein